MPDTRVTADEWSYFKRKMRTHPDYAGEQKDIEHLIGEFKGALGSSLEIECPICGRREHEVCEESL